MVFLQAGKQKLNVLSIKKTQINLPLNDKKNPAKEVSNEKNDYYVPVHDEDSGSSAAENYRLRKEVAMLENLLKDANKEIAELRQRNERLQDKLLSRLDDLDSVYLVCLCI